MLGDFNSVTATADRKSGVLDITSGQLAQLCDQYDLIELPGVHVFTYQHPTVDMRKSRIERIYLPKMFGDQYFIYTQWCQCSDHSSVILAKTQKQRTLSVEVPRRCSGG